MKAPRSIWRDRVPAISQVLFVLMLLLCVVGETQTGSPTITNTSPLPDGPINVGYSVQLKATGGSGYFFYAFTLVQGKLPNGLGLSQGGLISGTPTVAGTFNFTVKVVDYFGNTSSKAFSISIISSLTLTTSALTPGGTGQNYSQAVTAIGGSPPYSFSASGVPPGLSMSTSGNLTGTPMANGSYVVIVTVTDSANAQATRSYPLTILSSLTIVTDTLVNGSVGQSYYQGISVVGGTAPYTFVGVGFPFSLPITPAGIISGTPAASDAGTFMVEVDVMDAAKHFTSAQYSFTIFTQPTISTASPLPAGTVGVSYSQIIGATQGLTPYNFYTATSGTTNPLPPGLTLALSGALGGTPTAAGNYSFSLQVVDGNNNSAIKNFQLTINPGAAPLTVSPLSLQFSGAFGGDVPGSQSLAITSGGPPVQYTVQADDGNGGPAPAWLKMTPTGGTTPGTVRVSILPNTLPVGKYTARIRVGPGPPVDVTVTFTVSPAAPMLSVSPGILRFHARIANPQTQQQTFFLSNTGGGGSVPITLTVTGKSPWITSVTPSAQTIQPNSPVLVKVIVNSQGLPVGAYRDAIHITTSLTGPFAQFDVPVSLSIANQGAAIAVLTSGIRIPALQGNTSSRVQQIFVRNAGDPGTVVNWTAQAVRGAGFVTLTNTQGISSVATPASFSVQATSTALSTPGAKSALIQISDPQSLNSPQFVVVVVDVAPAGTAPFPDPDPPGELFVSVSGGAAPASQQVTVNTTSADPVAFSVSPSTDDGAPWLSATAGSATTSQGNPAQVTVLVSPGALSPGIYTGQVNIAIGAQVRSVNITLIVKPVGTVTGFEGRAATAACTPASVALVEIGLSNSFSVTAGFPSAVSAKVADNCGNLLNDASVVASFSNGDPPIILIGDQQSGFYAATWQPVAARDQVTVTVDATSGSLNPAKAQLSGNVNPNGIPPPSFATAGLLNNLNPLVGAPLAPGTVAQVYGTNLATSKDQPTKVPLPTVFDGIEVLVGGLNAPFFYVDPIQLVVQLPTELTPKTYSTLLIVRGQYTVPQDFDFVPAVPGTVALGDGTLVAQHAGTTTLVDAAHPARPGEALTMYLVGMGATTQTVVSGNPAPSDPLARVTFSAQVTIDGQTAPISFAGLTPGGVGLYQINFSVPAGARTGSLDVVITQNGVPANATKLIVAQ